MLERCRDLAGAGRADNARAEVWVHDAFPSDDPIRTFYEIPDEIAQKVRKAACVDGESFAGCLHNLILEREGALGEVTRLKGILGKRAR